MLRVTTVRTRRRRPGLEVIAVRSGVYGRDSRYRVPDARYRSGYRLTPAGARARLRLRLALFAWLLFLIAGAAAHSAVIPVAGTLVLAAYGGYRYRVNRRPGTVLVPAGEVRVRQPIPRAVKAAVWQRDGGRCQHCRVTDVDAVARTGVHLHYDHIVPFSSNGADTERNIQLLCESCNLAKGNRYTG